MIEILGSSVAALVATECLLSAGVSVRRTPSGRVSPFDWRVLPDGRKVEVGTKLLELSYGPDDWTHTPVDAWQPGRKHRLWIRNINDYVRSLIDVGPEVARGAQRYTIGVVDPFLSGDPTSVYYLLGREERAAAVRQLEGVVGRTFWQRIETFGEACEIQCGLTVWQELVWPLLHKIVGWAEVPRAQHRKVWLPLWHPQSLLDALRGEPSYRPVRPMHFGVGALYEALEAATKDATVSPIDGFDPSGGPPSILYDYNSFRPRVQLPVAWRPPSVIIGVAWVDDEREDGVEWLIDADSPVFRRTWRNGVCCVEYAAGANIGRWAYDMGLTVLDEIEVRVPLGDVQCDDPRAIGYGSLNDQILQGLVAADRIIREQS